MLNLRKYAGMNKSRKKKRLEEDYGAGHSLAVIFDRRLLQKHRYVCSRYDVLGTPISARQVHGAVPAESAGEVHVRPLHERRRGAPSSGQDPLPWEIDGGLVS